MKFLLKLHIIIFVFACSNLQAQEDNTADCLEFTGKFDGTVKDLTGLYTVQLIQNNKVIKEQTLNVTAPFRFVMRKNSFYAVRFQKQGYISKTVSISTILPKKLELEGLYKFNLETNLISQDLSGQFKDDDIDFPVALVSYGKKCDCFEYNQAYTTKLINSMYNNLLFGN